MGNNEVRFDINIWVEGGVTWISWSS